jgi:hypothetical protein
MTLKEKFENVLHNWIDKDYNRQHVATELETDADEFAINFANWCIESEGKDYNKYKYRNRKELLEIYKKTL